MEISSGYNKVVASNATVDERMAFVRKVYQLLSLTVLTGIGSCYLTIGNAGFLATVQSNFILFMVLYIASVVLVFVARKKETWGLVALFSFTVFSGVMASFPVLMYIDYVFNAAVLSLLAFGGLSYYAISTKKDFSFLGGFLTVGLIVVVVGSLLNVFLLKSSGFDFFITIGGILLFSGLILYDTSNILHRYSTDEHIMATLSLYLDLLNLFLFILRFLGGNRD